MFDVRMEAVSLLSCSGESKEGWKGLGDTPHDLEFLSSPSNWENRSGERGMGGVYIFVKIMCFDCNIMYLCLSQKNFLKEKCICFSKKNEQFCKSYLLVIKNEFCFYLQKFIKENRFHLKYLAVNFSPFYFRCKFSKT